MLKEVIEAIVMRLSPVFSHMLAKYDPVHCKNCTSRMKDKSIEVTNDPPLRI